MKATRPAAVLVPVIDRSEPTVLLTLRTAELASHAGQVAFPGGKIDPADESPVAAALREAKEEIGLAPGLIEPIGYLDLYLTFSGFRILPTVARVKPDFTLMLNPREVVETFEVPLRFSDDAATITSAKRATGRDCNAIITPSRSRTATFGASPRVFCGISTTGSTRDDQADPHRDRAVSHPVRALCGVSHGDARRHVGPVGVDDAPHRHRSYRRRWCWWSASFLILAQFSGAPPGSTYVPAHVENGKFVPGATR